MEMVSVRRAEVADQASTAFATRPANSSHPGQSLTHQTLIARMRRLQALRDGPGRLLHSTPGKRSSISPLRKALSVRSPRLTRHFVNIKHALLFEVSHGHGYSVPGCPA